MAIAVWLPKYETGHPTVDEQHKTLFQMVNDLHHGIIDGQGRAVMGRILGKLATYTVDHFAAEEKLMEEHAYSDYPRHKVKHDQLTRKVADLVAEWNKGTALPANLSHFLADWLTHHIKEEDQAMITWMKAKGVH